jgi:hypothetical protein
MTSKTESISIGGETSSTETMNVNGATKSALDTTSGPSTVSTEEEDGTATTASFSDNNNSGGEQLVWYFSYGSNMNPEVFETKRKIKCLDHKVCKVPGYVLTYADGPLPYIEPAFCTCVKRTDLPRDDGRPDIHGVAFLITKLQYEHMLLTEGGWGWQEYRSDPIWTIGHYGEDEVECIEIQPEGSATTNSTNADAATNDESHNADTEMDAATMTTTTTTTTSKSFKAMTLVGLLSNRGKYDCNASKRYCDLVSIGAESSGLPAFYREYLKHTHPAYEPRQCWQSRLAKFMYTALALPNLLLEINVFRLFQVLSARKLECKKHTEQLQQVTNEETPSSSTLAPSSSVPTTIRTQKTTRRKRFQDITRPPWIIMKFCYLYRTIFLESIVCTVLFRWCGFPCGFQNTNVSKATNTTKK